MKLRLISVYLNVYKIFLGVYIMLLRTLLASVILLQSVLFSQELPRSLFINQEIYDLDALLKSNAPIQFSSASITNVLILSNAINLAVQNNLELAQAHKDLTSAQALYTGSIQDFYVPTVSAGLGASVQDYISSKNSSTSILADQGFFVNFVLPSVTISKTVFNGLGTLYAHRIAKENLLSSQNTYTNKIRDIVLETVSRYYDQILKQEEVILALDRLKQLQDQLKQAEINYANGRVSDYDVALAKSQFFAAQPAYYLAEKNRLYAQEDFYRYIGITPKVDEYFELEGDVVSLTNIMFTQFNEEESLAFILSNDTILAQLRTSYNNAKNIKGQQNSVRMPKIDLNFSYNPTYGGDTPVNNFSNATYQANYSIGASLRIPILEWIPGTGAASQVKSANENIKKAQYALLDAEQKKIVEIKNTLLNIRELRQTVSSLKITEEQSYRALTIATAQYKNGRISILELNQSQNDYNDARKSFLTAIYNEFVAKLFLQASMNNLPQFLEEIQKITSK